MFSTFLRSLRALLLRFASVVTVGTLACATLAVWLFINDPQGFEASLAEERDLVNRELQDRSGVRADTALRVKAREEAIVLLQERNARASRVADTLVSLESFYERWFGNREQQILNQKQIDRMRSIQVVTKRQIADEQRMLKQERIELEKTELRLVETKEKLALLGQIEWAWWYYLHVAWIKARWWLIGGAALLLILPLLSRFFLFVFVAPAISRGKPIQLAEETSVVPSVSAIDDTIEVSLWAGEILLLRPQFLARSADALARRGRWFLTGRYPVASVASGFARGIRLHNPHVGNQAEVTIAAPRQTPGVHLAEVSLPEGGSMIVRPSNVAGIIHHATQRPKIVRRWRFRSWQSWASGQFGYFEFHGPCRLILAGGTNFKAEQLASRESTVRLSRRVPADTAVAFTPSLEYRPSRTDRFWAYLRGEAQLFDSTLSGDGLLLVQDFAALRSRRQRLGRLRAHALRVFGI